MISIVIPTLNAEHTLIETLSTLVSAAANGVVGEVIIVDGGSTDDTEYIADMFGARILKCDRGRGQQLAFGAQAARSEWLLFLHSDTRLDPGWVGEVTAFRASGFSQAAAFQFRLDDQHILARFIEWGTWLRCRLFRLPYGDQGLFIHRKLYDDIGGYKDMPLMEDVALIRRLGRRRVHLFKTQALTNAIRYQKDGYLIRAFRNICILMLYLSGVKPQSLKVIYEK